MINQLVEKALRDLKKYWMADTEATPEMSLAVAQDLDDLVNHLAKYDGRIAQLVADYDQRMREMSE